MSLTYVLQAGGSITAVKTIGERVAALRKEREWSQADLARRAGVTPGAIGNVEAGTRKEPRNLLEIAAALGVSAEWLKTGRGKKHPLTSGASATTDHLLSLAVNTIGPPKFTWEQLMAGVDLSEPFELPVLDDALGPDIFKGCTVWLDPNAEPQAGRPVLVRDRAGQHYLRDYQISGGGRWQAVARQRGYAALDSEDDELKIVAVVKGYKWP